jgi:hypothetical protein
MKTPEGQALIDKGALNPNDTIPDINRLVHNATSAPGSNHCPKPQARPAKGPSADNNSPLCEHYQSFIDQGVPKEALQQALAFRQGNKDLLAKENTISIADYSQRSDKKRFFILDLKTGEVKKYKVSHGSGSRGGVKYGDRNHDGQIDKCKHSNGSRTNMTRPGFFSTAEKYRSTGTKGSHLEKRNSSGRLIKGWPTVDSSGRNALRLDGLSSGVNDKVRSNGVVMHGAWYNDKANTGMDIMGRSYGCPAFSSEDAPEIINSIQKGSLFYSYVPSCKDDHTKILKDVPKWSQMCNGASEQPRPSAKRNTGAITENPKNYADTFKLNQDIINNFNPSPSFLSKAPSDIKTFCPKYASLNGTGKKDFWAHLLTSMAKFESRFKAASVYDESQTSKKLNGVKSTGMLMLSIKSTQASGYQKRGCPIKVATDLKNPRKNLTCGYAIIDHLTNRDGCITCNKNKGAGAYWSVLRTPYSVTNKSTGKRVSIGKRSDIVKTIKSNYPTCF